MTKPSSFTPVYWEKLLFGLGACPFWPEQNLWYLETQSTGRWTEKRWVDHRITDPHSSLRVSSSLQPHGFWFFLFFAGMMESNTLLGGLYLISSCGYRVKTDFSMAASWAVLFRLLQWLVLIPEMLKSWGLRHAALPTFPLRCLFLTARPSRLIDWVFFPRVFWFDFIFHLS